MHFPYHHAVTEEADGEGSEKQPGEDKGAEPEPKPASTAKVADGIPDKADADAEIPKTRQHGSVAPMRPSASAIDPLHAPMTYPDDGPVAQLLRRVDKVLGTAEQALLFAVLFIVVLAACGHAIKEKITDQGIWWSYDVVRGGTFVLAMIGAAFATHQSRHLAMDLISRRLPPRARLVLQALLEVFTIAICAVLARSGWHQVAAAGKENGRHLIEAADVAMFLPVGAVLIIVHAALHLIIDVDYLRRGKLLPERARSGH
jgi:TRAP-type C4-dicarboxylate transport system permease small subunit